MRLIRPKKLVTRRLTITLGRYWSNDLWTVALRKIVNLNVSSWEATEHELIVNEIEQSIKEDLKPNVRPHDSGNDAKSIVTERIKSLQPMIDEETRQMAIECKLQELKILDELRDGIRKEMEELSGESDNPIVMRQREIDELAYKRERREKENLKKIGAT